MIRRTLLILFASSQILGCLGGTELDTNAVEQDLSPAPTNLVATVTGPQSASLTWDPVAGATGYILQRSNTPGTETNYTSLSGSTTSFNDSHLLASTQYCYVIRSYVPGAGGVSNPSNEQCITMPSGPAVPTNVTATATSSKSITVSWSAVTNATAYYVYESVSGGAYNSIGIVSPPTTSLVVSGLQPSTTYSFEVRAGFTGGIVSDYSAPASATTFPAGLEGYYRFDDKSGSSAVDASGYNRTATLSGGAAFASQPQSPVRDSADHNPSNVSFASSTSTVTQSAIPVNFDSDATISLWVNVPTLPTGSSVITFAGRRDAACGANQSWLLGDNATGLFFAGAVGGVTRSFGAQLTAGTWTHVAVTQHAGTIVMYVNGVQTGIAAYTAGPTSTGPFAVGAVGECANGGAVYIDELKIFSRMLSATEIATLGRRPTAPTNLQTLLVDSCKIQLGYTAPTTGADKYYMYRGTMSGNETFLTSNNGTTFNFGNMAPNTTTSWEVKALLNGLVSDFSNEVLVTTLGPPPAPTNLTSAISTCCTPPRVNLSWTAEPRAVVYRIYQSSGGGTPTQVASTSGTTYQVGNLTSGTSYTWYVVSQDDCQVVGPASNTTSQTIP